MFSGKCIASPFLEFIIKTQAWSVRKKTARQSFTCKFLKKLSKPHLEKLFTLHAKKMVSSSEFWAIVEKIKNVF